MVEIDTIKLTQIKKAEYNPRVITEENYQKLKNSVKNFGLVEPILINLKNNTIISGHQRYDVLTDLILTDGNLAEKDFHLLKYGDLGLILDTDEPTLENEDYEKALNITLNNTNLTGDYDFEKLGELLDELSISDLDISLIGFEDFEIDNITFEQSIDYDLEDVYEEPLPKIEDDNFDDKADIIVTVKKGDIYSLGEHKLMCGDSTKEDDFLKLIQNENFDCVLLDPPFDDETFEYTALIDAYLDNINILCMNKDKNLLEYLKQSPFKFHQFLVNNFNTAIPVYQNPYLTHLIISLEHKNQAKKMINCHDSFRSVIKSDYRTTLSEEERVIAHSKSLDLFSALIQHYCEDTLLDLFAGSGTSLIVCEQTNKKAYLMEKEEKHCQIIINRWEEYTGEKAVKL